jgi:hypothetical protein
MMGHLNINCNSFNIINDIKISFYGQSGKTICILAYRRLFICVIFSSEFRNNENSKFNGLILITSGPSTFFTYKRRSVSLAAFRRKCIGKLAILGVQLIRPDWVRERY